MTERFLKMRIIFCIIFSLFHGTSSKTINVATNGKVTLQPLVEGEIESILWRHNGNKMVEWDNKTVNVREYFKFKGRTKLDVKTGDVTIIHLAKDDSGLYDTVLIIQGKLISIRHRVEVIDPVTTAKVTCPSNATLHCEAKGDFLDYSWFGPGLQTAEMRGQTGPQISKENQDSVYTCVVHNPVSDSSVTYHASDCFTSGYHQLILGVVCAVIGVIGAAAGLGYYCYKINSRVMYLFLNNRAETHWK
ncbi:CD48 antigen-like isoform X2 [Clupea harengus]|uniref:CD48 antigen-like isoform X2 n=1 Tax=Clupea harengus TaxID=7950 RepID=A0A6P8GH62_CLUHA|nr:CD48 antigen-like isoform X2 [Clupea harengus]